MPISSDLRKYADIYKNLSVEFKLTQMTQKCHSVIDCLIFDGLSYLWYSHGLL